jgi:peptide/nickel transport system substrate-binding protein
MGGSVRTGADMGKARRRAVAAVVSASALALAACSGGDDRASDAQGSQPQKGGTLTILNPSEQISHLDPQRNYTTEEYAFAGGYLTRTLTAYMLSPDAKASNELVGDLATDTGKATDGAKTWTFTLRDGAKWEDGSDVTCTDIKYGVSRTFAQTVITDGPTYAIDLLDIPKDSEGNSTYKGPYETSKNDTAAFDKAVECSADGKTITFHLSRPAPDFNYTTTLTAFAGVPKAKDTGEKYDDKIVSNGPYKVAEYTKGQQLVLDRNTNWSSSTDTYRPAFPDKIVMKFQVANATIDQRMIADAGADQQALPMGHLETASLTTVFRQQRFANRRVNAYSPFTTYIAINVTKVPNLKHRQAILVAVNRSQIVTVNGGTFAGDSADGLVKPNLTQDYAPTGLWNGLLGKKIPETGDPAYAKQLIAQSGQPMPKLTYDYAKTPLGDQQAAALQGSLAKAGIKLTLNPLPGGQYYGIVMDKTKQNEMSDSGWAPDWPDASTVVPELAASDGGFNLSRSSDKAFDAKVAAAKVESDRAKQATMWQELNRYVVQQGWVLPLLFVRDQRLAGSKVGSASGVGNKVYIWGLNGSWPYADLFVKH